MKRWDIVEQKEKAVKMTPEQIKLQKAADKFLKELENARCRDELPKEG
jgi:hypothetical protein